MLLTTTLVKEIISFCSLHHYALIFCFETFFVVVPIFFFFGEGLLLLYFFKKANFKENTE